MNEWCGSRINFTSSLHFWAIVRSYNSSKGSMGITYKLYHGKKHIRSYKKKTTHFHFSLLYFLLPFVIAHLQIIRIVCCVQRVARIKRHLEWDAVGGRIAVVAVGGGGSGSEEIKFYENWKRLAFSGAGFFDVILSHVGPLVCNLHRKRKRTKKGRKD